MTYKEYPHPHQSDLISCIPEDYVPLTETGEGEKTYGVVTWNGSSFDVSYRNELPAFGGYIARESVYGNPTYCPNATKQHKKHLETYGSMPHLVFFGDEESAIQAGFRRCLRCAEPTSEQGAI